MPETSNPDIAGSLIGLGRVTKVAAPMRRKLIDLYKKEKHFVDTVAKSTVGAGAIASITNKVTKQPNNRRRKNK
tara:strand:- start:315 stop:536 length:222 start_codon:yes stop_codon:yes gene_type:complete